MIKTIALAKRRPDLSVDEFRAYYEEHHALLIAEIPHVVKYERRYVEPSGLWDGPARFDVIVEMWFSDRHDYDVAMARFVELRELFATDAARVFDTSQTERFVVVAECETVLDADREVRPREEPASGPLRDPLT